jgi:RHS repeat-associated protein
VKNSHQLSCSAIHRLLLALVALILLLAAGCHSGEKFSGQVGPQAIDEVPEDTVFYLGDHQGSPIVLTNARGEVIRRVEHYPYGSVLAEQGTDDPYAYVGNERDPGSGLSDFQARPYRPEAGIFLAPDPVAVFEPERLLNAPAALAPYTYSAADPINLKDATGEIPTNAYEYISEQQIGPRLPPAAQAQVEANRPWGWMKAAEYSSYACLAGDAVAIGRFVARLAVSATARRATVQAGKAALRRLATRGAKIVTRRSRATGQFARVMPRRAAKRFRRGTGRLAKPNPHNEAFVTTNEAMSDIVTRRAAAERLSLYSDDAGRVLSTKADALVTFDVADMSKVGLRSAIEVPGGRGFGFVGRGLTGGGALEYLLNNESGAALKACNIEVTHLF